MVAAFVAASAEGWRAYLSNPRPTNDSDPLIRAASRVLCARRSFRPAPPRMDLSQLAREHGLEIVASLFGVISVYLSARENIWSWPTALVNVLLSVPVYFAARLYSDMGLQLVYAALSLYGWYEWLYGGENRTELPVSRVPRGQIPLSEKWR